MKYLPRIVLILIICNGCIRSGDIILKDYDNIFKDYYFNTEYKFELYENELNDVVFITTNFFKKRSIHILDEVEDDCLKGKEYWDIIGASRVEYSTDYYTSNKGIINKQIESMASDHISYLMRIDSFEFLANHYNILSREYKYRYEGKLYK